jgi:hypothetical protein
MAAQGAALIREGGAAPEPASRTIGRADQPVRYARAKPESASISLP